MKKKNENLLKLLKEHKPIRIFVLESDFGIFDYDPSKEIYQGQFGYISIRALYKSLNGSEELNHLRIEEV